MEEGGEEENLYGGGCGGSSPELHRSVVENCSSRDEYCKSEVEITDQELM